MRRLDLSGRSVGVQLNPGNPNPRLMDFIVTAGAVPDPVLPMSTPLKSTMRA